MAIQTPQQALTYAQAMIKYENLLDQNVEFEILDTACARLWMAAPWSWTVGFLTTITIAASTTDYTITDPGDVAYIYRAFLLDGANIAKELKVESSLPSDALMSGQVLSVSLQAATTIRIYPKPPASLPATTQKILIYYKKTPPVITVANYTTPDAAKVPPRWFHVYKSAVLCEAYKYSDDARGFDITLDPTSKQTKLGGELAMFEYYLNEMRAKEPLPFEWETRAEAEAERR